MEKAISYVVGIAWGPGYYRHIRVPGDMTFAGFAKVILDSYQLTEQLFPDGNVDSTCFIIQTGKRNNAPEAEIEKTARLTDIFEHGKVKKFLFILNKETKMEFNGTVRKRLEEKTDGYQVLKTSGRIDMHVVLSNIADVLSDILSSIDQGPKKILDKLGVSKDTFEQVSRYAMALVNLNGIISAGDVYEIYEKQNSSLDLEMFSDCLSMCCLKKELIYAPESYIFTDADEDEPKNRLLIHLDWMKLDSDSQSLLLDPFFNVDGYVPDAETIAQYSSPELSQNPPELRPLLGAIRKHASIPEPAAFERSLCDFITAVREMPKVNYSDWTERLLEQLVPKNEKKRQAVIAAIQQGADRIRTWYHRGATPAERRDEELRAKRALDYFEKNIKRLAQEENLDYDQLRQIFKSMDYPTPAMRELALEKIDEMEKKDRCGPQTGKIIQFGQTGTVKKKKIGRNEPCPCGSGKKYKNCCGRNR